MDNGYPPRSLSPATWSDHRRTHGSLAVAGCDLDVAVGVSPTAWAGVLLAALGRGRRGQLPWLRPAVEPSRGSRAAAGSRPLGPPHPQETRGVRLRSPHRHPAARPFREATGVVLPAFA